MMGVAMELMARHELLSPEMRLLLTTGLLGGLTTFSTFSAEVVTLLLRKDYLLGFVVIPWRTSQARSRRRSPASR